MTIVSIVIGPALSEEQKHRVREVKATGTGRLEFFQTDIPAYIRGGSDAVPVKKETALLIAYFKPGRQSPFKILERVKEVVI